MTKKQRKMLIRILIAVALLIPALLIPTEGWVRLLLYLLPYGVIGYDVLRKAGLNIVNGRLFDENFLMALATVGAFAIKEYPEGVAVMLFYQIGELFQSLAVGKSRRSIAALMDIRPDSACVLRNGEEEECFPEEVSVGELLLVRPGEKIPLDGILLEGETAVNTAALTGESLPVDKHPGDPVLSGSVNLTGLIRVQVTKPFEESTVSRILELVENDSAKKTRTERFISRFARWYTPCVVVGAALPAVIPPLFLGTWSQWIHRALIFLVVSCPCALVISVPLSFFGGIGGASRKGILIKGANYMETLARVQTVIFDKTGTLTRGTFAVTDCAPVGIDREELLEWAAYAECYSNHPIADSILAAWGKEPDRSLITQTEELPGRGIRAIVKEKEVYAGNLRLMEELGLSVEPVNAPGTVVYVALGKTFLGSLTVTDQVKETAAEAIRELKQVGVTKTVMLTGDQDQVARAVGAELGIDMVCAGLLPDQKVAKAEELLEGEGKVAYVGDGINDAPVLSRADVGIAMGALGSDAAIEAADLVLMDDDPRKIAEAIRISRRTVSIVWQNIIFALGVKGVVLLLGALGLAGMWIAVFADVGVMILAILNAMRCLK